MTHDPSAPDGGRRRRPARLALLLALGVAAAAFWPAQRPLTAPLTDRIEIAGMAWVEVRAALAHGATAVIVPTGGIEQNGPHIATAKQTASALDREITGSPPSSAGRWSRRSSRSCRRATTTRRPATCSCPARSACPSRCSPHDPGHRAQPEVRGLPDDLPHRRPRPEPEAALRSGRAPRPRLGGRGRAGDPRRRLLRRRAAARLGWPRARATPRSAITPASPTPPSCWRSGPRACSSTGSRRRSPPPSSRARAARRSAPRPNAAGGLFALKVAAAVRQIRAALPADRH